jgi:hypothetical protein
MQNRTPSAPNEGNPIPAFTPVPRERSRFDGWTPERQQAFIDALADTGSVTSACQRINMSTVGAYALKRTPGAESFRAAWDAALNFGVQTLTDLAIDRVKHGTPVPIFWKGEQVGERRRYNERLHMFILKHHQPHIYSPPQLKTGTKHIETLKREWAEEHLPSFQERHQASLDWLKRIDDVRGILLRELAQKPETRAAWELLVGPTDWDRVEASQHGEATQFFTNNTNFPGTQVLLLQKADDEGKTVEDLAFGRGGERYAQAGQTSEPSSTDVTLDGL